MDGRPWTAVHGPWCAQWCYRGGGPDLEISLDISRKSHWKSHSKSFGVTEISLEITRKSHSKTFGVDRGPEIYSKSSPESYSKSFLPDNFWSKKWLGEHFVRLQV